MKRVSCECYHEAKQSIVLAVIHNYCLQLGHFLPHVTLHSHQATSIPYQHSSLLSLIMLCWESILIERIDPVYISQAPAQTRWPLGAPLKLDRNRCPGDLLGWASKMCRCNCKPRPFISRLF